MTHLHLIYLFTLSLLIQLLPRRTRTPPGPAASLFRPCISFQHADALGIPITTHNALGATDYSKAPRQEHNMPDVH